MIVPVDDEAELIRELSRAEANLKMLARAKPAPVPAAKKVAGTIRVVFYRDEDYYSSNPTTSVMEKEIGTLRKKKFFVLNLPAHPQPQFNVHVLRTDNSFPLEGKEGETLYLKYKSPDAFRRVEPVDEATAKRDLSALSSEDPRTSKILVSC